MHYVKSTTTEYNGGGFYVDIIVLSDGRCIGIDSENAVLYSSIEDFHTGTEGVPCIQFNPSLNTIKG